MDQEGSLVWDGMCPNFFHAKIDLNWIKGVPLYSDDHVDQIVSRKLRMVRNGYSSFTIFSLFSISKHANIAQVMYADPDHFTRHEAYFGNQMTLPVRWIPQAEDEWRFEDNNRSFVMRTDFPVHRDPKMKRREHPWDNVYLVVELAVVVKIRLEEEDEEYDSENEEATKWKTNEMSCGWVKISLRELMDEVQSRKGRSTTMKFNLIGGSLVAEESASTVGECSKGFQRHRGWRAIPKTFKNIVQGPSRSRLCLTVTYV